MFPEHVLIEILLRLPVKKIIHCKIVCKKLYGIISDTYFIKLHAKRSRECLLISECMDLETHLTSPGTLRWVDIEHETGYHIEHVMSLDLKRCAPRARCPFVRPGSVNGFVSCWDPKKDIIYIMNPVLDEYLALSRPQKSLVTLGYGFGVSSADEYKVIRISCGEVAGEAEDVYSTGFNSVEIEVYTLGTKRWRSLGLTPCRFIFSNLLDASLYLNSHVYWQLGEDQYCDFDLNKETLELFSLPPVHADLARMLGVVKGRISCIAWSLLGLEIWVMKEKAWCKETAIQDNIRSYFDAGLWRPTCVLNGPNGTSILMLEDHRSNQLVVYCLDTNTILPLDLHGYFQKMVSYRPNFLSLHNFGSEKVRAIKENKG